MADLGGPYPTPAPDFTDAADIIRALRLYHYGTETIPQSTAELSPDSVAGYIDNVLNRIDAVEQGVAAITNLTSNDNLNDISETGVFHGIPTITSQDQVNLGYPSTTTGILISYVANQTRYQMYQTSSATGNAEVYFRATQYGTSTWSTWQQVSKVGHTHNNLYYTISQINSKISTTLANDSALITNESGTIVTSPTVSATELSYLQNASSNIQVQINNRAPLSHVDSASGFHDDRYYQRSETARVFVQASAPTNAEAGDLWFY